MAFPRSMRYHREEGCNGKIKSLYTTRPTRSASSSLVLIGSICQRCHRLLELNEVLEEMDAYEMALTEFVETVGGSPRFRRESSMEYQAVIPWAPSYDGRQTERSRAHQEIMEVAKQRRGRMGMSSGVNGSSATRR